MNAATSKIPSLKIHLGQINTSVGDLDGNTKKILQELKKAQKENCDLVVFCEMTICGYNCQDLWQKKYFIEACQEKIVEICEASKTSKCAILLGSPTIDFIGKKEIIRNSALLIEDGRIKKIIHKKSLPNYEVFDESRYFQPSAFLSSIEFRGLTLAILICEDLWDPRNLFLLQEQIIDSVIVINSSPYSSNKHEKRLELTQNFAKTLNKNLIYVNQVGAQDELVFDGSSFVVEKDGKIALQMASFLQDCAVVEIKKDGECKVTKPCLAKVNHGNENKKHGKNYSACVLGLRDYIQKNGFQKVLLGMSGGIDSALVASIAVDALGSENVFLYALPSRFNSEESMDDAINCAKNLGVKLEVISIEPAFESMLATLQSGSKILDGTTKENLQSRIRGNILMALSNQSGALLLSTGNKSELACGYATIYGDMCGAFNPIKDLYKTEIYEMAKWRNQNTCDISVFAGKNLIPTNILTKAPTAELRENQKDSDSLPEYEILDKILFALIEEKKSIDEIIFAGAEKSLVKKISTLFYNSEYKRKQAVIGPRISEMSFDRDRRFPITNQFKS